MFRPSFAVSIGLALLVTAAGPFTGQPAAQDRPATAARGTTDLDTFMEKVLARREVNRKTLNEYVLDETETFEILGPGRMRLHRTSRDFTWYVRNGMHVRSPVRFDGVSVDEAERDKYEAQWTRREQRRQERRAKKEPERGEVTIGSGGVQVTGVGATVPTEPRFVSEAYFMDFKFEPGNYLLAGRETLEGQQVLRIEYYPTRLFGGKDKKAPREIRTDRKGGERELEDEVERQMNKTALVTLWVDPANHQIVKYTFDNVWLDFLPGAWLVRIDDLRASMTMSQPFPGVWLPRAIDIHAGLTLANGSFEAGYERRFTEYREAQVSSTIRVPKVDGGSNPGSHIPHPNSDVHDSGDESQAEVVREVRVHGNAFLADADVLALAGVAVGAPLDAGSIAAIEKRLEGSGRFETVEVRKRYRSLDDPTDVALVLIVHERPGIRSASDTVHPIARPWQRFRGGLMFLPIVNYGDGYGFTYGGRVTANNTLGLGERLSVPATWGGMRRIALELERTFDRGPLTRITSSAALWQRENPRYEIDDRRVELKAGIERQFAQVVRLGAEATRADVEFGDLRQDIWTLGTTAALDLRRNPAFPRNAVYLGAGWNGLHVEDAPRINRYTLDGRGYLGLLGQSVLAGRAQYVNSDAPLPLYERLLLGGAGSLRGFRTGSFDGDRLLLTSGELRVPITSVISGARLGVTVFMDAAKVADHGQPLDTVTWQRGAGAGLFLIAPLVTLNLDVAKGFDGGTRVHFATGFPF